jgi:hypothetical protein
VPAFAGTVFITIVQKKFYFFLEAFFLPPFFLDDFFLVAIVVDLHVELVRAQYIHKLKIASKGCVQFSDAESDAHHALRDDECARSSTCQRLDELPFRLRHRRDRQSIAALQDHHVLQLAARMTAQFLQ